MFLIKLFSFYLSLLFQYFVAQSVINRAVNTWSLFFWIASIIFFYFPFPFAFKKEKKLTLIKAPRKYNLKTFFLVTLVIALGIIIRLYYMGDVSRFHLDEYQTAYFSHLLGDFSQLDWFAVFPGKGMWVSRFPLFFFFFQKIFFLIFGIGTMVIRFSTLPYIFIVFLFLFLIAEELFNIRTALFSIILLSFFGPDLYLSTWGLHIISSTALFYLAFYFFIKSFKEGKKWQFALLGLFSAFCYLTYYSSYIALPLFVFSIIILFWQKKIKLLVLRNFLLSLGIFLLTMGPTLVYSFKVDNFFLERISQVSLFHGSWSPYSQQKFYFQDYFLIFKERLVSNIQSLYRDGVGGVGGYDFGHLAFFDKITLLFFCLGVIYFLYKVVKHREFAHLFILTALIVTFITGMVLTMPSPAYHRLAVVFPLMALLLGVFYEALYQLSKRFLVKKFSRLFIFTILVILLSANLKYFQRIIGKDKKESSWLIEHLQIERDVKKQEEKTVFISAFSSYALGRILFFRFNGQKQFITGSLDSLMKLASRNKSLLLILHYPDEKRINKVKKEFSKVEVLGRYQTHLLLRLL